MTRLDAVIAAERAAWFGYIDATHKLAQPTGFQFDVFDTAAQERVLWLRIHDAVLDELDRLEGRA